MSDQTIDGARENTWNPNRVRCLSCGHWGNRQDVHTCRPQEPAAPSPLREPSPDYSGVAGDTWTTAGPREPSETPEAWSLIRKALDDARGLSQAYLAASYEELSAATDALARELDDKLAALYRRSALPVDTPPTEAKP